jgi:hypothetical protein
MYAHAKKEVAEALVFTKLIVNSGNILEFENCQTRRDHTKLTKQRSTSVFFFYRTRR